MKMSKKPAPVIKKTATIPVEDDAILTVAHSDVLLLISVTRIPWHSADEEERVRQRCRTLQDAVARCEALPSDPHDVIPLSESWWPLPIPNQT